MAEPAAAKTKPILEDQEDGLSESVRNGFSFLCELTDEEEILAKADNRDRSPAIKLLRELPGGRFAGSGAY